MHKTQMYESLRDMLEREVKEIEKKNDLDPQSLDNVYKLTCSIKNIDKVLEKEEREKGGMSMQSRGNNAYGNSNGNSNAYGNAYASNNAYGNTYGNYGGNYGYGSNGNYGSNGGYSEDNFRDSSYRRSSYERGRSNGYSRESAKESMVNRLMDMADTANERDRMAIMDCIDKIR